MIEDLYPICRSITGDGLRATLRYLQQDVPLEVVEVPTGTQVLDWTVPREWNISDAYVKDSSGARVIDFAKSNLHVVNYSVPVRQTMSLAELGLTSTRCPSTRSGSPTGPPTTRRRGDSVSRTPTCSPCGTATTRSASTAPSRTGT